MNLSQIPGDSVLGRVIRLPFRLIPKNAVVRVLRGPARGRRWIADSTTHGFWLGYWELDNQWRLASRLRQGDVVYDIGAHVGLYTLLSSARVGETGHVYAFEPLQRNLVYLRRHVELNCLANCSVVEAAVSDASGSRHFDPTGHDSAGHFSETGLLTVEAIALDDFVCAGTGRRPPNVIKINAEGAELEVLRGARKIIARYSPLLFLSTHSEELAERCGAWLRSAGYSVASLAADKIWAERCH